MRLLLQFAYPQNNPARKLPHVVCTAFHASSGRFQQLSAGCAAGAALAGCRRQQHGWWGWVCCVGGCMCCSIQHIVVVTVPSALDRRQRSFHCNLTQHRVAQLLKKACTCCSSLPDGAAPSSAAACSRWYSCLAVMCVSGGCRAAASRACATCSSTTGQQKRTRGWQTQQPGRGKMCLALKPSQLDSCRSTRSAAASPVRPAHSQEAAPTPAAPWLPPAGSCRLLQHQLQQTEVQTAACRWVAHPLSTAGWL